MITDQIMADMTGLELAAAIRRLRSDIPHRARQRARATPARKQTRQHGIQDIVPLLSRELRRVRGAGAESTRAARPAAESFNSGLATVVKPPARRLGKRRVPASAPAP
ncbi:MAG: hypothetical protein IPI57_12870 [Candidatus Competibacteraceae bacterium]|nr:hypothetical protein [Candidatus Competibacteraceae bacterium]